jgi:hypothetical protein
MGQDQTNQQLLQDLVDTLPDTISQLDTSLVKVDEQIDFLQDDLAGVEVVMSMMTTAASGWMYTKQQEYGATHKVITSGGWGISNLTDWVIVDTTVTNPNFLTYKVFSWGEVTSGAPSAAETQQYNRQIDFLQAYDHIYHDNGLTGTYGINDKITNLQTAKSLQQTNKTAFEGFLKVYDRNKDL